MWASIWCGVFYEMYTLMMGGWGGEGRKVQWQPRDARLYDDDVCVVFVELTRTLSLFQPFERNSTTNRVVAHVLVRVRACVLCADDAEAS